MGASRYPYVGEIVLYREIHSYYPYAAIVTHVSSYKRVDLSVFMPDALDGENASIICMRDVPYDENGMYATWRWTDKYGY